MNPILAMASTGPQNVAQDSPPRSSGMTIGRLARTAGVGVETVRYYQRRRLLPVPDSQSRIRRYSPDFVARIRFIKRSQALGFSLEEIRALLRLERAGPRAQIRRLAEARLEIIRSKITDLQHMEQVLAQVVEDCRGTSEGAPCPIILALRPNDDARLAIANGEGRTRTRQRRACAP